MFDGEDENLPLGSSVRQWHRWLAMAGRLRRELDGACMSATFRTATGIFGDAPVTFALIKQHASTGPVGSCAACSPMALTMLRGPTATRKNPVNIPPRGKMPDGFTLPPDDA